MLKFYFYYLMVEIKFIIAVYLLLILLLLINFYDYFILISSCKDTLYRQILGNLELFLQKKTFLNWIFLLNLVRNNDIIQYQRMNLNYHKSILYQHLVIKNFNNFKNYYYYYHHYYYFYCCLKIEKYHIFQIFIKKWI